MALPDLGTISYGNGPTYTFGPFAKSRITSTPVPDRASRTTKYVKHVLRVDDIVFPDGGDLDIIAAMTLIRQVLTARCSKLVYEGRGFGVDDLVVNDPEGTIRDVAYGPIPEIIEFYPLGGMDAQAAKISWQVTTVVPECATAKYKNKPLDFSYEVDWRIEMGYTTRTITGAIEIPATRISGARVPPDVADSYREQILDAMPPLPGFKRSSSFRMNLDKRVESFTVTDQELEPSAFFGGADSWSGDHTVGSQLMAGAFTLWMNTITATFRVNRDRQKKEAWDFFTLLLSGRIVTADNYMPIATQIREELNGQTVTLTHSWKMTLVSNGGDAFARAKLISNNGLFRQVKGTDWQDWAKAAAQGAQNPRGYAGLVYKPEWDAIIDLCSDKKPARVPPQANDPAPKKKKGGGPLLDIKFPGDLGAPLPKFGNIKGDLGVRKPPKAADSFLAYECHLEFLGAGGNARHKPLGYTTAAQAPVDPMDVDARTHLQQGSTPPDVIQSVGPAACRVALYGKAIRAGYAVVPPKLIQVGGVRAILDDEQFENADLGNAGGLSIFGGRWMLTYILDRVPAGAIGVPTNLLATQDGSKVERV